MKRILNEKGFAITSFLYSIFLLAIIFLVLILLLVGNSSPNFFKFQKSVKNDLDEVSYTTGGVNNLYKIVFDEENPVIKRGDDFDFLAGVKLIQYDGTELNNTITYTVSPTFDNNKAGKYLITYQTTVNGSVIKRNRVLVVQDTLVYANGQRVYFDVVKGTGCTMEEYASSYDNSISDFRNSLTGYNGLNGSNSQNSCLLFYAFNHNGEDYVELLLDHNVTQNTYWTNSSTTVNTGGPKNVLSELKSATNSWNGTEIPEDYTVSQSGGGNYTIKYATDSNGAYKARLIKAQEIAKITGADKKEGLMFNESTTSYINWFYFDTLSYAESDTCKSGNTTGCQYGWLYDRLVECKPYGCYNNADAETYGYWTGTSAPDRSLDARSVYLRGYLDFNVVNSNKNGVRPVITVSKSKITPGVAPVIPGA